MDAGVNFDDKIFNKLCVKVVFSQSDFLQIKNTNSPYNYLWPHKVSCVHK